MPNNPLLAEFVQTDPYDLKSQVTDAFDAILDEEEEVQISGLKEALIQALEARINAIG